jgi:hypothetical protein
MPPSRTTSSRRPSGLRLLGVALVGAAAAASLTLVSTASAGIIPPEGWNLDNVTVALDGTGSTFDPVTGDYFFGPDSDYSYQADVDNGAGEVMGIVLAKDWPIGEPPGIKIVNDDTGKIPDGRPTNCIMATSYLDGAFLDSTDPQQVLCSGPFQSHKRFKVAMLPSTVDGGAGAEDGIDLVFDVDPEAGSRDYQVFQKINNWTNGRLDGFTIEVGTGIGADFVPALDPDDGVGVENLSLSVPADFFDGGQLATFSDGLFGPIDTQHDRPPGFFDQDSRAGFTIAEYPNVSGVTDTLTSGAPLESDYGALFGPWLPNNMLPTGIFFDDDGNPDTDAQLVAWYGFNPVVGALGWMTGAADGFAAIPDETIEAWGQNLEYTSGVIDDLVNVGLNYIVTVGDTASFTVRVTPSVDESGTGVPAFVGAPVTPPLVFAGSDGVVSISPAPEFPVGAVVTARVGDADLNADRQAIDEVDVDITVDGGAPEVLTLVELGPDRGVFAAILPASLSSDLSAGSVVTATYVDADNGDETNVVKSASTTAVPVVSSDGVVSISPAPTFPVGAVVTARVGDTDLNSDPQAIDEVDVDITVDGGAPEVLTLVELGPDRGVFEAILPASSSSDLPAGSVVTATYVDADNGLGGIDVEKSASTTAIEVVAPTAPTGVVGVAGDGEVAVSWTAPASDGGSAITGYTVTASPGDATCTPTWALTCTVTGLTNGTPYTFTVTATNDVGTSEPSEPSAPVTPMASPVDPVDPPVDPVDPPVEPSTPANAFLPLTPVRVLDTRNTVGGAQLADWDGVGPVQAGSTVAIPVRSAIPAGSPVAVVNVTATRAAEAGFLTVYECDQPLPNASNLNYLSGENRARAALAYAPVSADGQVCVYSSATTDLIVDVSGYTPDGGSYVPRNPVRLADTREASPLAANATLRVAPPAESSGFRSGEALAISVTSVNAAAPGFLTAYSCDDGLPAISTLNYTTGTSMAIANLTIVGNGDICVTTSAQTDVLVDLQGHFTETVALDKARLLDTRTGAKPAAGSTTQFDPTNIAAFADSPMAAVNVTATRATEGGFLTVWNCADPLPNASVLNYDAGDTFAIANLAMLKTTSPICVYTSAPTDIILDLVAVAP